MEFLFGENYKNKIFIRFDGLILFDGAVWENIFSNTIAIGVETFFFQPKRIMNWFVIYLDLSLFT